MKRLKRSFAAQLRARHEKLQKRQERERARVAQARKSEQKRIKSISAQGLLEGFRSSLSMHAKVELQAAVEEGHCGIIVWGFGRVERDDEIEFSRGLNRILQEFARPLGLFYSRGEVFMDFGRFHYALLHGGIQMHICIHGNKGKPFRLHNHFRLESNSF